MKIFSKVDEPPRTPLRTYPIQLAYVTVKALSFEALRPVDVNFKIDPKNINVVTTFGQFDPSDKSIQVGLGADFGWDEKTDPEETRGWVQMRVRLVGHFFVDDTSFPVSRLEEWGKHNAPMLLFPFLREQVFSLTVRCGIAPVALPLVYLPTSNLAPDVLHPDPETAPPSSRTEPELGLIK